MIGKKNLHLLDSLFEANKEKSLAKKNYWEEGDLLSQKDIAHIVNNFFITFKR